MICGAFLLLASALEQHLRALEIHADGQLTEHAPLRLSAGQNLLLTKLRVELPLVADAANGSSLAFFVTSQAQLSGLGPVVKALLTEYGFKVQQYGGAFYCVVEHCANADSSGLADIQDACSVSAVQTAILWVGPNDFKASHGEGEHYQEDLGAWLAAAKVACGAGLRVVFVETPMFPVKASPEWPIGGIPAIQQRMHNAAEWMAQQPGVEVVYTQRLATQSDFDDSIHFCKDGRACPTSEAIGKAIVAAAESVSAEAEAKLKASQEKMPAETAKLEQEAVAAPASLAQIPDSPDDGPPAGRAHVDA